MRTQKPGVTPPEISIMQIDQDLKDGISKSEMAKKYNIKPWEVDEMFKHSFLKGRRPSRKKALLRQSRVLPPVHAGYLTL